MVYKNHIKKVILNHKRRLQKLEQQKALFGANTPPEVLIEIEDIEAAIKELQTKLQASETNGPNQEFPRGVLESTEETKKRVVIYLSNEFDSLSTERRSAAIDAFAAVIGIEPQAIEVYSVYQGSIVFELGIPSYSVQRLRSQLQSNSAQLRALGVKKVILERQPGESEEWILEERKFHLLSSTEYSLKDKFITNLKRIPSYCVVIFKGIVRSGSSLSAWIETKFQTNALTEAMTKAEARAKALEKAKTASKVRAEAKALAQALAEVFQAEAWFIDTDVSEILEKAKIHTETVALLLTRAEAGASARTEARALDEVKALAEAKALAKALADIETYTKSKEGSEENETQDKTQDEVLGKAMAMAETMATAIAQLKSM